VWTVVRLEGVLDEHNALDQLLRELGPPRQTLVIDLGGLRRLNSVGVRDWVFWMRELRERYQTLVLLDCTPAVMGEVNLVRNFAEGAVVWTIRAPYYCERCGQESVKTLDAVAMRATTSPEAPSFPCAEDPCGNALDDAPETYFAFLEDQREVPVPEGLAELIAQARASLASAGSAGPAIAASVPGPAGLSALGPAAARSDGPGPSAPGTRPGEPTAGDRALPSAPRGLQDLAFVAIVLAMTGLLAFLIYLISTLE